MPGNRISVELDLRLLDSSNAIQKLAELRTQLNGLGGDVERASRQQGWAGLRNIELGAQNIAAQVETIRQVYLPSEISVQNAPEAPAKDAPRTATTTQENIRRVEQYLQQTSGQAYKTLTEASLSGPPPNILSLIENNLRIREPVNSGKESAEVFRSQYRAAELTSPLYNQVAESERRASVAEAFEREQQRMTQVAEREAARRQAATERETQATERAMLRGFSSADRDVSRDKSIQKREDIAVGNATIRAAAERDVASKAYVARAQELIQEGYRASYGPIPLNTEARFLSTNEIERGAAGVRRIQSETEKAAPQRVENDDYDQRLRAAIARQQAAEQSAREEPFPLSSAQSDASTPQARVRMRDEASASLPDPARIATVRAQIEQLTRAWNDLTDAQRKSGTGAAIQNMMGQARTQLQELNRVTGPSPEAIARFDELIKKTDASGSAIKRAQYEFNRGNIQAAESILTVNSQLQREVDNQTKSRFSTTTIGDILKEQQSGSGRGGGGGTGSRGYTSRQADLSRAFGGGPEELGGFAAFRGINRAGALEIQAAIINSIQAAASGMSLSHVAMMESAQVGGGLVQGGLITFGQILSFLSSPIGIVTAAFAALGVATYAVIASMVNASNQIAAGVNVAAAQGRNTGDARGNIESMANQVRLAGGLGRQESRSLAIAVNSIPNISSETRQTLLGSGEAASRVFFGGDLKKTEETFAGFGDPSKLKAFIDQFGLLHGAEKQAFDDAVAIGDGLTASSIGARAIAEQLKPASSALQATREEMGTLGRILDFFGFNFEARLNRRLGHGGPFAGFRTAEFPSGSVRPPEIQIQGDIAAERTLKTESEINGLIRQRANLQSAVAAQPDNERYQRALIETEYRIRNTRTPEEQRERTLTGATLQTQAQQARVAAQIDPSAARGIAAAAKAELDDIVAHEQSAAATREGITAELTAKRIEAEQRYRDAVRETQQIILTEEISRLNLQRAERPADVGFQRQAAESAFDVTVRNPSSTQAQRDERLMEVIKARQQEDLETQNVAITQLRANMALAEARGDLEEIVRLRQQENEIIQSRPDIRSRLERATSQAETERVENIQTPQRELGREIGRIGVERALNAPDSTFQRVALERELNALIASGLSTEEQRLQKIVEIVNARRQERLEAENLRVAQMAQNEAVLQYQQNFAEIVDLRRQEAAIIQSSADRTPLDKMQAQGRLLQTQVQALQESVRLEEQFVQSANRFTSQRAQTQTASLNYQVETGAIRPSQALQAEQAINSQVFASQRARLQTLLQDQALQPTDRARINSELAGLYEQDAQKQIELQTRITAAIRQENERRIENMKAFFKDVESGVTDAFAGVISGQKRAADAFKELRQNLVSSFIKNAEEMFSKAAGRAIAPSLGVNLKEGEDSSISSVLSKALGSAIGLTKPEPKLDQAAVAQKMQRAGELQQQAGELMLKAAQGAANAASQAPLNARTGRPPDSYTPERTPTRSIDEIPRRLYDTKAQPGVVGGASAVEATRVVPQTYETDNAIGEGISRISPVAASERPAAPGAYGVPGAIMNYGGTGALGTPEEAAHHLVPVTTSSGATFRVNEAAAPAFQGFLGDLEATGYKIDPSQSSSYANRSMRGGSAPSEHSFGTAIDINSAENPFKSSASDLPPNIHDMAAKWGLVWGGDWKSPRDPMHFQWGGPNAGTMRAQDGDFGGGGGVREAPPELSLRSMQVDQPPATRTVGDLLSEAAPRYRDVTGGQDIKADFERAWGHPLAEMSTARRIQSALGDEQLKPMALQANEAIQAKYPGLDIESAFKAGKPGLDELRAIPLREQAQAPELPAKRPEPSPSEPIKVDPASVAQGVAQGEQQSKQQAVANAPIGDGAASSTAAVEQLDQSVTAAGASLQSVADASAPAASSFQTAASDATTMGDSLVQAGNQATQAGQQFQQAGTQAGSGSTGGGTGSSASGSSSGGLLSGVGELASAATAVSALTGAKTSPIVREITAGVSLLSTVTKLFSGGGLFGGLFGGGGGGGAAASGGSSAFGGLGSIFSGFTSLFSLFALREGGVIPSAEGGLHVQETSLSSSVRSGLVNMAQSGNVIPFSAGRVMPGSGGHLGVNDGKGGRLGILHPNEMVVPATETRIILNHLAHGSLTSSEGGFVVPSITGGSVSISRPSVSMPGRASLGVSATAAANNNAPSTEALALAAGDTHHHHYAFSISAADSRDVARLFANHSDVITDALARSRRNFNTRGR